MSTVTRLAEVTISAFAIIRLESWLRTTANRPWSSSPARQSHQGPSATFPRRGLPERPAFAQAATELARIKARRPL